MNRARDWKVVINDTGDELSGWPSVCSEEEDRCVLHTQGFKQEFWDGPSLHEAKAIAQHVANFMNSQPVELDPSFVRYVTGYRGPS